MAFNPDAYLANNAPQSSGFDPDAYINGKPKPTAKPTSDKFMVEKVMDAMGVPENKGGLFGTSLGKGSEAMRIARIPARAVRAGGKILEKAAPGEGFHAGQLGSELISGTLEPESAAVSGGLAAVKALAPAVKATGRFIGSGFERLSGLTYDTPGALARTTATPSLPFKKGTEAVSKMYEAAKIPGAIAEDMTEMTSKQDFITRAYEKAKVGVLNAEEALEARKELGRLQKSIPGETFRNMRKVFDSFAKEKFKGADKAFTEALDAENLRNLMPLNKTGSPSIMKILLALGAPLGGSAVGAGVLNPATIATAPLFSPFVQAMGASGVGLARKMASPIISNPETGAALSSLLQKGKEKFSKRLKKK